MRAIEPRSDDTQTEQLDGLATSAVEPVRDASVEFGGLAA
jgi:hypothetical protein